MSHQVLWPKKKFFYPIGNTSPVSFTRDLTPEVPAKILLLGCGDPRSIFYTIYTDLGAPYRNLDFTCCDAEPAILARNILLFTLIIDSDDAERIEQAWNLFFHFYLDPSSLRLLRTQCQKLIELSTSVESWADCQYAYILRFCSKFTLSEIRQYWELYERTEDLPKAAKMHLQEVFTEGIRSIQKKYENTYVTTASRSAGPLWPYVMLVGGQHFKRFWTTGVTFNESNQIATATFINPTFAYSTSGKGFNVHYGTDPIIAFHLAMVASRHVSSNNTVSVENVVEVARIQFHAWCLAFRNRATWAKESESPSLVIRLFAGDALAFSRALHSCNMNNSVKSNLYNSPWKNARVDLDERSYSHKSADRAPVLFNSIDTSNLTDHIGLLNVLAATLPLLQETPVAVLHTNTILTSEDTHGAPGGLAYRACTEISTLSLLLGVVPISCVSGFSFHSNTHEILSFPGVDSPRHECIAWKMPPAIDNATCRTVTFKPEELGTILFDIYLRMFSNENPPHPFQKLEVKTPLPHYTRASFAILLGVIKDRTRSDWPRVMQHMTSLMETDRTLFSGRNHYQDLRCQLHLLGIYTVQFFKEFSRHKNNKGIFRDWDRTPPVVCVVLKVPRNAVKCLEDIDVDRIGTPTLRCEVESSTFNCVFSSIQIFLGKITVSSTDRDILVIDEDPDQWAGESPLVVSFYLPSWILNYDPTNTRINLSILPTTSSVSLLLPLLGLELRIFSAHLNDKNHVWALRERPGNPGELQKISKLSLAPKSSHTTSCITSIIDENSRKICGLRARENIIDSGPCTALRTCKLAAIRIKQASPYSMLVSFGGSDQHFEFPFPIDGTKYKLRIARTSSYIEVDVALSDPFSMHGFSLNPFPMFMSQSIPSLWNIHAVNLTRSPVVDITSSEWLKGHLLMCFSDREQAARHSFSPTKRGLIINVKETIMHLLSTNQSRMFGFHNVDTGHVVALIFINDLRLDLPSHTVVGDACVVPLNQAPTERENLEVLLVNGRDPVVYVNLDTQEIKAWWQLLPALAERCREWKHTENCEYKIRGVQPSFHLNLNPFCSCGTGKALPESFLKSKYKGMAPFSTRIALSPLFPVSYLESIGTALGNAPFIGCQKCHGSGKPNLLVCSGCKRARYCSKACQKQDWKLHKIVCSKNPKTM